MDPNSPDAMAKALMGPPVFGATQDPASALNPMAQPVFAPAAPINRQGQGSGTSYKPRQWSPQEDQKLFDMTQQGHSVRKIGDELGVNKSTVWRRQNELGVYDQLGQNPTQAVRNPQQAPATPQDPLLARLMQGLK